MSSRVILCYWGSLVALALAGTLRAAPAEGPDRPAFWAAKAADHYLAMKRPTGDDYLDVMTALSQVNDIDRLRRVVSAWEKQVTRAFDHREDRSWLEASAHLSTAEGWARAGNAAAHARAMGRADATAEQLDDETKAMSDRKKPEAVAFRDADRALELVRAVPGKRQPERFVDVAWACSEARNSGGMRRALDEARAAAEQFLDEGGRRKIASQTFRLLAYSGDLAAAAEAAGRLPAGWRMAAYERLVEVFGAAGRAADVDALLKQMAALVRDADPSAQIADVYTFAASAANLGRGGEALPLVRSAEQNVPPPADPVARGERAVRLAYAYTCAGDADASRRFLEEALAIRSQLRAALLADLAKRRAADAAEAGEPVDVQRPPDQIRLGDSDESGRSLWAVAQQQFDDANLCFLAFALARAGRLDEAVRLSDRVDPTQRDNAICWAAKGAAAAGDVAAARRLADPVADVTSIHSVARWVAEELARRKKFAEITVWADSRPNERARLAAYVGAAEGLLGRRFWEPRLGF